MTACASGRANRGRITETISRRINGMEKARIPFFKKADLDASIGVFFDGFSKVIVAIAILAGTFGLDSGTIFGTMMPGMVLTVVVLNGGLWLYYRGIAAKRTIRI
jgi:AGZA family xanthine/uracil permease-like MFS transporter